MFNQCELLGGYTEEVGSGPTGKSSRVELGPCLFQGNDAGGK